MPKNTIKLVTVLLLSFLFLFFLIKHARAYPVRMWSLDGRFFKRPYYSCQFRAGKVKNLFITLIVF